MVETAKIKMRNRVFDGCTVFTFLGRSWEIGLILFDFAGQRRRESCLFARLGRIH
jgi:hypothetical protein